MVNRCILLCHQLCCRVHCIAHCVSIAIEVLGLSLDSVLLRRLGHTSLRSLAAEAGLQLRDVGTRCLAPWIRNFGSFRIVSAFVGSEPWSCFWIRRKYVASSFARHWAAPLPGASMCRSWASRRSSGMFFHATLFGEDSSETWVFVTFLNHLILILYSSPFIWRASS